ncbi:Uncharacterized protein ChrSV_1683 [Chromobacterium vaccinii]|nr:Uncharacterized protein ChrSW_1683 [Chromobacterium vaccinii]QND89141.1 Uncharacterized protein ChrSV_1683 [Chromobacterium vaccinii]
MEKTKNCLQQGDIYFLAYRTRKVFFIKSGLISDDMMV